MTTTALRRVCTIALVGLAMIGATIGGTPANAKPGKAGTGAGNCVIELANGSTKPVSTTCFGRFTEAISFATQGRVTDAPAGAVGPDGRLDRRIQESNQAAAVSPNAAFVLSIEYFDTAGFGPALVFIGATQCTASAADVDYQIILDSADWDQISTYASAYCLVNHFYLQDLTSPSTGFTYCSLRVCALLPMNPGNFPGDNNTRALRWT